ncbi:MAG: hypothetical protein WD097_07785 [Balneolales bacterium]
MGRIKKQLTETDYDKISRLAERGVKEIDICKALGVSFPTWKRLKSEDERAIEVFSEARKIEEETLVGVLYESATKQKNITAAMFLLKARHGYVEGREHGQAQQVNVQITVPGAMPEKEYQKLIEVSKDEKQD